LILYNFPQACVDGTETHGGAQFAHRCTTLLRTFWFSRSRLLLKHSQRVKQKWNKHALAEYNVKLNVQLLYSRNNERIQTTIYNRAVFRSWAVIAQVRKKRRWPSYIAT